MVKFIDEYFVKYFEFFMDDVICFYKEYYINYGFVFEGLVCYY